MIFAKEKILTMSETDVREEIIRPIIRKLGYIYGSENYCQTERILRYPFVQIGRRTARDILPSGRLDYICGVDGARGCFVIEAKSGKKDIDDIDIAQAQSYSSHSEINATFFAICNGLYFNVYQISESDKLILSVKNGSLNEEFWKIQKLLSPESLVFHSRRQFDLGEPVFDRSERLIFRSGFFSYEFAEVELEGHPAGKLADILISAGVYERFKETINKIKEFEWPIFNAVCERDNSNEGKISIKFSLRIPPKIEKQYSMIAHPISIQIITNERLISSLPEFPTIFETKNAKFPIPSINQVAECRYSVAAYLDGSTLKGRFEGESAISIPNPIYLGARQVSRVYGHFELQQ